MSQKILDKLEEYEQLAYDDGYGEDWLIDVGEGFKFYVRDCIANHTRVSISGFIQYIDNLASNKNSDINESLKNIREKIKNGDSTSTDHSLLNK
jgi:hypothetical protein